VDDLPANTKADMIFVNAMKWELGDRNGLRKTSDEAMTKLTR